MAMAELGKSQEGEAASALGALAACCASHATSSGAKAQALYTSLDVPMRDLVRCAGAAERRTQVMQHVLALTLRRSAVCRSLGGVHGALAARHSAHTTHLALLADVESKRAKLTKLRCALSC